MTIADPQKEDLIRIIMEKSCEARILNLIV